MKRLQTQSLPIQISQYLIETNPEFTIKENFISSNYMLERIGFSPDEHIKKLGDAFYEQQLIRDQIFEQSGRVLLNKEVNNQQEQYEQLMNNAVELFESSKGSDLELTPGISLSKEQIDALTSDIVWMEEKIINNQIVLVPQVYLANPESYKIAGGKILANEDINLKVNKLLNGGLFEAGGDLIVSADTTIENNGGTFQSDNDLKLTAVNNITNTSGTISGGDVALTSTNGSIINQRFKKDLDFSKNGDINKKTLIGREAKIISRNSLSIDAKNKFQNIASDISSGGDTLIKAKDVEITTVVDSQEFKTGDKKNYLHTKSTKHIGSNVDAKNLTIIAQDTTTLKGANVDVKEKIGIKSGSLDILAVNDTTYSESKSSSSSGSGALKSKKSTVTKKATSTNVATNLNADNITLITTKEGMNIKGSNVNATDTLAMKSEKGINIEAGYDGAMNESHTKKSGFGGLGSLAKGNLYSASEDLEGKLTKTAVNSNLGGKIIMDAKEDVLAVGVNIDAKEGSSISGENVTILNAQNETKTYSRHTRTNVSISDLSKAATNPSSLIKIEDSQASITLAEVEHEKDTSVVTQTEVAKSNINGEEITFNALSNKEGKGNILLQGTDINAKTTMNATNNADILSAKNTTTTNQTNASGKGELKVVTKNEYVEMKKSLDNLAAAKNNLEQTKEDYDTYKKDLKQQEEKLQELKTQLANNEGFIESSDIEELESHIKDLKTDENFYKTNIALATTSVATASTAVLAQGKTAAGAASTSMGTGMSVSLEANIKLLEEQLNAYDEQSVASNINNDVIINAKSSTLQGANIQDSTLTFNVEDVNIKASQDVSHSTTNTQQKELSASISSADGLNSLSVSKNDSNSYTKTVSHTNTNFQNSKLIINNAKNTNIEGVSLDHTNQVKIITDNLIVASVQDTTKTKSNSKGVSVGFGNTGGVNSLGINQANSNSNIKETVLTTLHGSEMDITVNNHTNIKGASIATTNEKGEATTDIKFVTNTLSASSLNNTNNSKSTSTAVTAASTSTLDYTNTNSNSKTKTLATLGEGSVTIKDQSNSNTKMLNRDVANNTVDIYDIESHKGLNVKVDTNLLTEDGRKKIKEDLAYTTTHAKEITQAIEDVTTNEDKSILDYSEQVTKYATDRDILIAKQKEQAKKEKDGLKGEGGAEQTQKDIQELSNALSKKDNLEENTEVALYDGTQTPDDTKVNSQNDFNKELSNAGHHDETNSMIINVDKTDMTDSTQVIQSTLHEQERHTQSQTGETQTLSEDTQTNLSKARGERGADVWETFADTNDYTTKSETSQTTWNNNNAKSDTITSGNAKVNEMKSEDVKPRTILHTKEKNFINDNADQFAQSNPQKRLNGSEYTMNEDESKRLLKAAFEYYNDDATKEEKDKYVSEYSKEQLEQAYQFLQENSNGETFTHLSDTLEGTPQPLFTSTPEQKGDEDINVNTPSTVGASDVSLELIAPTKAKNIVDGVVYGAKATKSLADDVAEKVGKVYDDVTLGAHKVINEVSPTVGNKALDTKTALPVLGGIEVVNDVFNESSPIPSTVKGTVGALLNNISDETEETVKEKTEYLKKRYEEIKEEIVNDEE